MSQQEFEQNDQEVMNLVNSAASPQAKQSAEKIEKELGCHIDPGEGKEVSAGRDPISDHQAEMAVKAMHEKWRRQKLICGGICVTAFIIAAVMLVIVLENPVFLEWFVYGALLICGIVVGFQIEKMLRFLR